VDLEEFVCQEMKSKSKNVKTSPDLPGSWRTRCVAYDSLKLFIKKGEEARISSGVSNISMEKPSDGESSDSSISESSKLDFHQWENAFSTKFQNEINKVNQFYDDKMNECMERLKAVEHEVAHVFSRSQTVKRLQFWCDFTKYYIELVGTCTRAEFISSLDSRVGKMDDSKMTEIAAINILKKIVGIHRESLKVKTYGLYNLEVFKRVLKKFDKKIGVPLPDFSARLSSERFCSSSCDVFDKVVSYMKEIIRNGTPTVDDFSCSICLELLHKPTIIQCKHRFCAPCLRDVSHKFDFCPMCRMQQSLNPAHHTRDKPLEALLKQQFPEEYRARHKALKTREKHKKCIIL